MSHWSIFKNIYRGIGKGRTQHLPLDMASSHDVSVPAAAMSGRTERAEMKGQTINDVISRLEAFYLGDLRSAKKTYVPWLLVEC